MERRNEKDRRQAARFKVNPDSATPEDVRWLCMRLEAYIVALSDRDEEVERLGEPKR